MMPIISSFRSFRTGTRISLVTSGIFFVVIYVVLSIMTHGKTSETLLYSGGLTVLLFLILYATLSYILQRRLSKLQLILENILENNFDQNDKTFTREFDELDRILNLSVSTNNTIEKEIRQLKRMENYRKEFIGDVSHELKTPTFAIQGFIETLINGALEDPAVNREFLKKAMKNVNRLIFLTNDLMEISKLETGEQKTIIQDVEIKPIILEIIENLQYKAEREKVTFVITKIDPHLRVKADRNQIRQVLINLIDNAIKYNKAGGTVTIDVRPYDKDPTKLEISVSDTGIGIDQKDIERLTERFYRVDKSRSREKGGTGLGLSIVKHIIEAHNEKLFIRSEPQKGSTFSFTLQRAYNFPGLK